MSREILPAIFLPGKWRITRWKITETWRDAAVNLAAYLQKESV